MNIYEILKEELSNILTCYDRGAKGKTDEPLFLQEDVYHIIEQFKDKEYIEITTTKNIGE